MVRLLLALLLMTAFSPMLQAQVRSPEIEAFAKDTQALVDSTKVLQERVQAQLQQDGLWEPTGTVKEFWTALERLVSGVQVCERLVRTSSEPVKVERSILKVFIRNAQLNDTSPSLQLNPASLEQMANVRSIVSQMEQKYISRKSLDPKWELRGGLALETKDDVIAAVAQTAGLYLNDEYAIPYDDIKMVNVTRLGVYHRAQVDTSKMVFLLLVNNQASVVIFERHYTKAAQ